MSAIRKVRTSASEPSKTFSPSCELSGPGGVSMVQSRPCEAHVPSAQAKLRSGLSRVEETVGRPRPADHDEGLQRFAAVRPGVLAWFRAGAAPPPERVVARAVPPTQHAEESPRARQAT